MQPRHRAVSSGPTSILSTQRSLLLLTFLHLLTWQPHVASSTLQPQDSRWDIQMLSFPLFNHVFPNRTLCGQFVDWVCYANVSETHSQPTSWGIQWQRGALPAHLTTTGKGSHCQGSERLLKGGQYRTTSRIYGRAWRWSRASSLNWLYTKYCGQ